MLLLSLPSSTKDRSVSFHRSPFPMFGPNHPRTERGRKEEEDGGKEEEEEDGKEGEEGEAREGPKPNEEL